MEQNIFIRRYKREFNSCDRHEKNGTREVVDTSMRLNGI